MRSFTMVHPALISEWSSENALGPDQVSLWIQQANYLEWCLWSYVDSYPEKPGKQTWVSILFQ